MEKSGILSLSDNDVVRSLITAVFVAVVTALYGVVAQAGFDLFTADWASIGRMVVNVSFVTFIARLGEKFVTDERGKLFGRIG